MTKSELIERLVKHYPQLVAKDLDVSVKMILEAMCNSLVSGRRIEIRGFGAFKLAYHAPRIARNPKSGKVIKVPAKYVPHFKPGKEFENEQKQKYPGATDPVSGNSVRCGPATKVIGRGSAQTPLRYRFTESMRGRDCSRCERERRTR